MRGIPAHCDIAKSITTQNAVGRIPADGNRLHGVFNMPDFSHGSDPTDSRTTVTNAPASASNNPFSPKIPCRKCLIEGLNEADVMAKLQEYIDAIEPSRRTSDDVYRDRLSVCETCPQLAGGMCRLCGCFVLYRAATAGNSCPDFTDRWNHF